MPNSGDTRRLSELTVEDAKRVVVYAAAVLLAVGFFVALVGKVLVALLLGVVAAVYLLPVQEWLERRLRARPGGALITIALIVVPLAALVGYSWYELSGYSEVVKERQSAIIEAISAGVERYVPVSRQGTRAGLEVAFSEAVTRSAAAVEELRERAPLILASLTIFFFTVFYVLTQRVRLAAYVKLRVPGEFHPLYEQLTKNIGGALRGALQAVFLDQLIKGVVIFTLNVVFDVPLALVLAIVTFLMGFFPLVGEWLIYLPVSVYLLVFRDALVAGVYTFGIPGIVLGPAILGFVKAVADTLLGDTRYETSLLKEERVQQAEAAGGGK